MEIPKEFRDKLRIKTFVQSRPGAVFNTDGRTVKISGTDTEQIEHETHRQSTSVDRGAAEDLPSVSSPESD
jgi:hypothetical protein